MGIGRVGFDHYRLSRLPARSAALEIYRRMKRYGPRLAVSAETGVTPLEFAACLNRRLGQLTVSGFGAKIAPQLEERIREIMNGIIWVSYRPGQTDDGRIFRQWRKLRWQLWAVWMLKSVKSWPWTAGWPGIPKPARLADNRNEKDDQ
jgi:hypothetical protein